MWSRFCGDEKEQEESVLTVCTVSVCIYTGNTNRPWPTITIH